MPEVYYRPALDVAVHFNMNKVLLFNPHCANHGYRIPNSILQIGASIDGIYDYVFVDGNLEKNPFEKILYYFETGEFKYFCITVMPGPQLKQAIPFTKKIKKIFRNIVTIWGGYFPSNQYEVVINSEYVDYIINGPGDKSFPQLLNALEKGQSLNLIENLIFKNDNKIVITNRAELIDQDSLPPLPYEKLNALYPISKYLGKTFLGKKTAAYHSSMGCPFTCSFCAVVPIYKARWVGKSAENIYKDILLLKNKYEADAVEFHDNNFFVSEKRVAEFSKLILNDDIKWWGEGRIDTINKYSDETLGLMQKAGCKMIFLGAETGNDERLRLMDKGGTQSREIIKKFAQRIKEFNIIPEYSFVLGIPAESDKKNIDQIEEDIEFIREIKKINPDTEIIIYIYSPVYTKDSDLFNEVEKAGFKFPKKLEDWLEPEWEKFDLRKNPLTPWLKPFMINKIRNFETVLNSVYPTVSDIKLTSFQKKIICFLSSLRYKHKFYTFPIELKILQKFWLHYRQPEIEGFYSE